MRDACRAFFVKFRDFGEGVLADSHKTCSRRRTQHEHTNTGLTVYPNIYIYVYIYICHIEAGSEMVRLLFG